MSNELTLLEQSVLRASYFLYFSAFACFFPFLAVWLADNDFTTVEIGIVAVCNQLSIFCFVPLFCGFIDLTSSKLSNNNNNSQLSLKYKQTIFTIFTIIAGFLRLLFVYEYSYSLQFFVLSIIGESFQESVMSTMDGLTLLMLDNNSIEYGKYRMFGAIAWPMITLFLGYAFDNFFNINHIWYFYLSFMLSLATIWILYLCIGINTQTTNYNNNLSVGDTTLPIEPSERTALKAGDSLSNNHHNYSDGEDHEIMNDYDSESAPTETSINNNNNNNNNNKQNKNNIGYGKKLILFLNRIGNWYKISVILAFYAMGIGYGILSLYSSLWLIDLGGDTTLVGWALVMTIVGEIPAFYVVDKVLKNKYIGELGVICIGLFAYIIRLTYYGCLGYWFLFNPWFALFIEPLHGLTFAWIWSSLAIFAFKLVTQQNDENNTNNEIKREEKEKEKDKEKKEEETELKELTLFAQGFLSAVFHGLGEATGDFVGGYIYYQYNGHYMFFFAAIVLIPFFILFLLIYIHKMCYQINKS